jgi:sterol desaturase/sphingolipid hydroxylase (fatty acid hydroxylase superfamily)
MAWFFDHLVTHHASWRSGIFVSALMALAVLEIIRPRRVITNRPQRWFNHLFLGAANIILLRIVLPGGLMAVAIFGHGDGLIGWLGISGWAAFFISLIALDFVVYAQHVGLHKVPFLWPLHAPHHGDRALDVSSGLRFHPGEALVSAAIKAAAILALGAPLAAVIAFEIILSAASLFTHANWALGRVDGWLRWAIVTPDMHRIHHSRVAHESHRNFGFFISLWDRLFNTWQAQPENGHQNMAIGLDDMPDDGLTATLNRPWRQWVQKP